MTAIRLPVAPGPADAPVRLPPFAHSWPVATPAPVIPMLPAPAGGAESALAPVAKTVPMVTGPALEMPTFAPPEAANPLAPDAPRVSM